MSIIQPLGRFRGDEVRDRTRNHLEPAELRRLFDAIDAKGPFWAGYFRLQYYFGCRVSEVALVLKEDVSFEKKQIVIRRLKKKQFQKVHAKNGARADGAEVVAGAKFKKGDVGEAEKKKISDGFSYSVYGLPDALVGVLERVVPTVPAANRWFFGSTVRATKPAKERMAALRTLDDGWRSVSRSSADTAFRDAAVAAGIPKRLAHSHVLRHTRATLLLASGAKEENVQFLLGHSSITTTRRYLGAAESMRLLADVEGRLGLGDLE